MAAPFSLSCDAFDSDCNNVDNSNFHLNQADFGKFFDDNDEQGHAGDESKRNSTPSFMIRVKKTYVEEIDVIAMARNDGDRPRHFHPDSGFRSETTASDTGPQFEDQVPVPECQMMPVQRPDKNYDGVVPSTAVEESGPKLTFTIPKSSLFDMQDISGHGRQKHRPVYPVVVLAKQTKRPKLALTWPEPLETTVENPRSSMNDTDRLKTLVLNTLVDYPGTFPYLNDKISVSSSVLGDLKADRELKSDGSGQKREGTTAAAEGNQEVPNLTIELPPSPDVAEDFYEKVEPKKRSEVCTVKPIRVGLSRKQPVQQLHSNIRR